jgi:hypothetical protein
MGTRNIDMFEASQVKQAPFSFDAEDLLHAWKPVIFCANNIKKNKKYITTALQSFASSRAQTSDTSGILTKQGQHFSPQTLGHA